MQNRGGSEGNSSEKLKQKQDHKIDRNNANYKEVNGFQIDGMAGYSDC